MKLNKSREWYCDNVAVNSVSLFEADGELSGSNEILSKETGEESGAHNYRSFCGGAWGGAFCKKPLPRSSPQGGSIVFGLKDLIQQAQGLQSKMAALQEELADKVVVGSSGGDMVKVEANGAQEILSITIEKELLDPADPEMLQDLIVAAVNDALKKSRELMAQEMSKLTGGLPIPGLTV